MQHSAAISGGVAAYFVILLAWLLPANHQMPPEVQAAVAGLITAAIGYAPSILAYFTKPTAAPAPAQGGQPNA